MPSFQPSSRCATGAKQPRRIALVIGKSAYENAPLKNPKRDAEAIAKSLEGSGASLRVIIFDACRNNPFRSFMRSGKVGLVSMQAPEGTVIAYSMAAGTEATDGECDNSPFARHFVNTIAADHPRGLEVTPFRDYKKLDYDKIREHAELGIAVLPLKLNLAICISNESLPWRSTR